MPKFVIQETITREYEVDAIDLWDAHEKAMNLDDTANYTEHSEGVTYIREVNGTADLIL